MNFNPHQYAIDAGWDFTCIEATAEAGVSEQDVHVLEEMYGDESGSAVAALLKYCQERIDEHSN